MKTNFHRNNTCTNCGAPLSSNRCEYCGGEYIIKDNKYYQTVNGCISAKLTGESKYANAGLFAEIEYTDSDKIKQVNISLGNTEEPGIKIVQSKDALGTIYIKPEELDTNIKSISFYAKVLETYKNLV